MFFINFHQCVTFGISNVRSGRILSNYSHKPLDKYEFKTTLIQPEQSMVIWFRISTCDKRKSIKISFSSLLQQHFPFSIFGAEDYAIITYVCLASLNGYINYIIYYQGFVCLVLFCCCLRRKFQFSFDKQTKRDLKCHNALYATQFSAYGKNSKAKGIKH